MGERIRLDSGENLPKIIENLYIMTMFHVILLTWNMKLNEEKKSKLITFGLFKSLRHLQFIVWKMKKKNHSSISQRIRSPRRRGQNDLKI